MCGVLKLAFCVSITLPYNLIIGPLRLANPILLHSPYSINEADSPVPLHHLHTPHAQLTSAPDDLVLTKLSNTYLHITLVVSPSGQAKDAKLLDQACVMSASGSSKGRRCALPEPLRLSGQILAVR